MQPRTRLRLVDNLVLNIIRHSCRLFPGSEVTNCESSRQTNKTVGNSRHVLRPQFLWKMRSKGMEEFFSENSHFTYSTNFSQIQSILNSYAKKANNDGRKDIIKKKFLFDAHSKAESEPSGLSEFGVQTFSIGI